MKEITDKMRLNFIEASGACLINEKDDKQWGVSFNSFKIQDTYVNVCVHKDELKPTLREAIDAAIVEDATYN